MKQKNLFPIKNRYDAFHLIGSFKKERIHPDESVTFRFDSTPFQEQFGPHTEYRLRFVGEVDINPKWRNEGSYPILYRRLCESLERGGDGKELLHLHSENPRIPRCAYYKIYGEEAPATGEYAFSLTYRTSGDCALTRAAAQAEVYYQRDTPRDYDKNDPDLRVEIPLTLSPEATTLQRAITVTEPVDFMVVSLLAEEFTGDLYLETPSLTSPDGTNLISPFRQEPLELKTPRWVGENLSKIEWPAFELSLNGKTVFQGALFDRIVRWPAFEIPLKAEDLKPGQNTAELRLVKEYETQKDFLLLKAEMVVAPGQGVLAYDRAVRVGRMPILIKTALPDTEVTLRSDKKCLAPEKTTYAFAEPGLHVVAFQVEKPFSGGAEPVVTIGGEEYPLTVERYLYKKDDVFTGTGDSIYVNLNWADFSQFAAWYAAGGLGNLATLRTSYRWSGSNCSEEGFWEKLGELYDALGVRHNTMVDGRELPNSTTNRETFPAADPLYDGRQSHEQDGAFNYWQSTEVPKGEEFFNELIGRRLIQLGMLPCGSIARRDGKYYKHFDGRFAKDMKGAAEYFLQNIDRIHRDSKRHTGPSVLFKYFYQSGVEWLGAELMYGTMDVCVAALRGASAAYGKESYGGHLAIQWSSTPHDSVYRYRRYLLGLYDSYLNGLDQINTEEGCWRMEEQYADFERNSAACMNHAEVQRHFTNFVKNHNRRGKPHTSIALLQGQYDGFTLFGRGPVWGQKSKEFAYAAPETSWDLLKIFYPGAKIATVYRHPCLPAPQGFFTNTPYGQVDIIPSEAQASFFSNYPYLIMMGWNTADEAFVEKLHTYVENGGTLLLSWPHLYGTTDRMEAIEHRAVPVFNEKTAELLGVKHCPQGGVAPTVSLSTGRFAGKEHGAKNQLLIENQLGKGRVLLVNAFAYPSEKSIKKLYTRLMTEIAQKNTRAESAKGWVGTNDQIATSIFDSEDRRTIYLLDVKWWRPRKKRELAYLHIGKAVKPFRIERDVLNVLSIFGNLAVMTSDETTDVLSLRKEGERLILRVQGYGETTLKIFEQVGSELVEKLVKADLQGVMELEFAGGK